MHKHKILGNMGFKSSNTSYEHHRSTSKIHASTTVDQVLLPIGYSYSHEIFRSQSQIMFHYLNCYQISYQSKFWRARSILSVSCRILTCLLYFGIRRISQKLDRPTKTDFRFNVEKYIIRILKTHFLYVLKLQLYQSYKH